MMKWNRDKNPSGFATEEMSPMELAELAVRMRKAELPDSWLRAVRTDGTQYIVALGARYGGLEPTIAGTVHQYRGTGGWIVNSSQDPEFNDWLWEVRWEGKTAVEAIVMLLTQADSRGLCPMEEEGPIDW